jgi:glycosyltransferase involved in cell wall biosynthesis
MNILIYGQYFWPESFLINELALGLKAKGNDVFVITGKPNYPEGNLFKGYKAFGISRDDWQGISILRLPLYPRGNSRTINLALNYLSFIFSGIFLAPFILKKNKELDVIFVYAVSPLFQVIPAIFLGWLRNIPVVLWVQDLWPESTESTGHIKSKIFLKVIEWLVKFCYSHVDLILVQSKGFIGPVSLLAPNKKIIYYPNSVDKSFFSPSLIKLPKIEALETGFNVLFAGNIGAAQSIETILDAAERLLAFSEIKIVILGSGSRVAMLKEEIASRNLNNIFCEGRYPVESMPLLMRKASVLLVSLANKPIFNFTVPNKIQAYLAIGRPIVASLNGEAARLIEEAEVGFTAPAENSEKLADAILKLYFMSDHERDKLGENGRKFFKENFDQDGLVIDLINHFKAVVKRSKV